MARTPQELKKDINDWLNEDDKKRKFQEGPVYYPSSSASSSEPKAKELQSLTESNSPLIQSPANSALDLRTATLLSEDENSFSWYNPKTKKTETAEKDWTDENTTKFYNILAANTEKQTQKPGLNKPRGAFPGRSIIKERGSATKAEEPSFLDDIDDFFTPEFLNPGNRASPDMRWKIPNSRVKGPTSSLTESDSPSMQSPDHSKDEEDMDAALAGADSTTSSSPNFADSALFNPHKTATTKPGFSQVGLGTEAGATEQAGGTSSGGSGGSGGVGSTGGGKAGGTGVSTTGYTKKIEKAGADYDTALENVRKNRDKLSNEAQEKYNQILNRAEQLRDKIENIQGAERKQLAYERLGDMMARAFANLGAGLQAAKSSVPVNIQPLKLEAVSQAERYADLASRGKLNELAIQDIKERGQQAFKKALGLAEDAERYGTQAATRKYQTQVHAAETEYSAAERAKDRAEARQAREQARQDAKNERDRLFQERRNDVKEKEADDELKAEGEKNQKRLLSDMDIRIKNAENEVKIAGGKTKLPDSFKKEADALPQEEVDAFKNSEEGKNFVTELPFDINLANNTDARRALLIKKKRDAVDSLTKERTSLATRRSESFITKESVDNAYRRIPNSPIKKTYYKQYGWQSDVQEEDQPGTGAGTGQTTTSQSAGRKEVRRQINKDGTKIKIIYNDGTEEIIENVQQ